MIENSLFSSPARKLHPQLLQKSCLAEGLGSCLGPCLCNGKHTEATAPCCWQACTAAARLSAAKSPDRQSCPRRPGFKKGNLQEQGGSSAKGEATRPHAVLAAGRRISAAPARHRALNVRCSQSGYRSPLLPDLPSPPWGMQRAVRPSSEGVGKLGHLEAFWLHEVNRNHFQDTQKSSSKAGLRAVNCIARSLGSVRIFLAFFSLVKSSALTKAAVAGNGQDNPAGDGSAQRPALRWERDHERSPSTAPGPPAQSALETKRTGAPGQ